ncbi:esterase/lipase family protein [Streptomyces smyrnaeus]|uniref:esterase/lipase family protein n=1 Tax=Streptomyces smyrnaeus TaxID=1387713 RepID=UPI0027DACAD9|nr:alpha/beta hydrolase [Streptomyces smyrnaeus]
MDKLPIIYVRGYAGPTAGIDNVVDDPFYGFNRGATHVRIGGDGDPRFYQFEGPLLRLMGDEGYRLLVQGDQHRHLLDSADAALPPASLWVYRFYDQAATTFVPPPHENVFKHLWSKVHHRVTANGFNIEAAAAGLYDLITLILQKTGAPKVHLVAHSMGGLVVRCMMQKICFQPQEDGRSRLLAKDLVAKFFTYGTPHGGIDFQLDALDWAQQAFGPAGSDIFAPEKMYGYLEPGAKFGDTPPRSSAFDPQTVPEEVFPTEDIFCLVGTNPKDYGLARLTVGPKSDGLVSIDHAYVRRAHRAYVHRSHSGPYGEVNSEEGYQNLRRFLFGPWQVALGLTGLPAAVEDEQWQADMRLAIRGLPVIISDQRTSHWCPIQLSQEVRRLEGSPDGAVPLAATFLLEPARPEPGIPSDKSAAPRMRYSLTLRVFKLDGHDDHFRFADHLEQVPAWSDSLIVDIGPDAQSGDIQAWAAWNSMVEGPSDSFDPITDGLPPAQRHPATMERDGEDRLCRIDLPPTARALPVLGADATVRIHVHDRRTAR